MTPHLIKVLPPYRNRIGRIVLTSSSGNSSTLPAGALGVAPNVIGVGWVRVKCRMTSGTNAQFFFSPTAQTCTLDAATSAAGWPLLHGQAEDFFFSSVTNELVVNWAADGNGFLDFYRAGEERIGQR